MTPPPLSRILVGVDVDDSSAAALQAADALSRAFDATVTVVHAHHFDRPAYFTATQMNGLEAEWRAARDHCAGAVTSFVERHLHVPFTALVEDGPPAEVIRRRHGPRRWWLGSVAESVLREAPVPVLVVPSETSTASPDATLERTSS